MIKAFIFAIVMFGVTQAHAGSVDAARGWSSSMGYNSVAANNSAFNRAYLEHQMRKGYKGPGTVIYSTSTSTATTNCEVAGACQNGGEATNINGYSAVTVTGENNTVGVDVVADSDQDATATSVVNGCCDVSTK